METLLLALAAGLGFALVGRIGVALFRDSRRLYRSVRITDGSSWMRLGALWGGRIGLQTGVLIGLAVSCASLGADMVYRSRVGEATTPLLDALPTLAIECGAILAASLLGWSLFGVYWAGRWASGGSYFWGLGDPDNDELADPDR